MNGLSIAIDAGLLIPVTNGTATLHHSANDSERRLTDDEYKAIRTEMGSALKEKSCHQFIDRLISYVRGTPFDSSKEFLKFSNDIYRSADGGIFWSTKGPSQVGGKIRIGQDIRPDLNVAINAAVLMHELIHGLQGPGSDDSLVRAIRDLGIVPRKDGKPLPFPTGMRNGKPYNDWSEYWDRALKNACFPKL